MKWDTMRRNSLGIWKNIGKIVILLFQIVYEQVKWYIHSWSRVKRDNPKDDNIEALHNTSIPYRNDEEQESLERSKIMLSQYDYEQVEWSENPHIREIK